MFCGAAQREMDHAGADGAVGEAVDQDEAAGVVVLGVGIESDRLVEAHVADADLVQFERFRGQLFQRVDVDLVLDIGDGRRRQSWRRS